VVEQRPFKPLVVGSTPTAPTNSHRFLRGNSTSHGSLNNFWKTPLELFRLSVPLTFSHGIRRASSWTQTFWQQNYISRFRRPEFSARQSRVPSTR
jgi:hypothetical protein